MKQAKSNNRLKAREVEKSFMPAFKVMSTHIHGTGEVPKQFVGYEAPAGIVKDKMGRDWQLKVSAVVAKSKFLKKDELKPIMQGFTLLIKLRVIIKHIVDWSSSN